MERKELKAVILFSGGFDSVALYHYVKYLNKYDKIYCLYVEYGNTNFIAEWERVLHWRENYKIELVRLHLSEIFGKSLLHGGHSTGNELKDEYVPMRNFQFLSLATAFAEVNEVRDIYFGFVDNLNVPYPDASPLFLEKANDLVGSITGGKISVKAPFIDMTKGEISELIYEMFGREKVLELFKHTISCNTPVSDMPCGVCETCKDFEEFKINFEKHCN